ncbi:hypothetical protein EDD79_10625 [Serpentinicella alkaliphila]|uniref:Uncharacterized protein n=1 Tax=Serpentinicella alkaliphila TaxID=1734049 RepID=A0A4V2T1X9_9FIRM|nr:hypothetical protein EDD79_10625 [Serpentinicella alkaliphila]
MGDYELIKLIDADEAYDLAPEITGYRFYNLEASNVKV